MPHSRRGSVAAVAIATAAAAAPGQTLHLLRDLAVPHELSVITTAAEGGGAFTGVWNIRDQATGDIVGGQAYVWTRDVGFTSIGEPSRTGWSGMARVSPDGSSALGIVEHDISRWTRDGGIERLASNPSPSHPVSPGIANAAGSALVGTFNSYVRAPRPVEPQPADERAYLWTKASGLTLLDEVAPLPGARSMALAVSPDGRTVLGSSWDAGEDHHEHLFTWSAHAGYRALPPVELDHSFAYDVNDAGEVTVGGHAWSAERARGTPSLWTEAQGVTPLLPFDTRDGFVTGIGGEGAVFAGRYSPIDGSGGHSTAFIWSREFGFIDLDAFIADEFGIATVERLGFEVLRIADDGRTFSGVFFYEDEPWQVASTDFVLTIPAPASLLVVAWVGALTRRRRIIA